MHRLQAICFHETAGAPINSKQLAGRIAGKPTSGYNYTAGVQLFLGVDGILIQNTPITRMLNHGTAISAYSVGLEQAGYANWMKPNKVGKTIPGVLASGMHFVTHKGKSHGDIDVEPGKIVPSSPAGGFQMLGHPDQLETCWKTAKWISGLSGKPDPDADPGSKTVIDVPMEFPHIRPDEGKFWWTKWNGGPTNDQISAGLWFLPFAPNKCPVSEWATKRPRGISCHARNGKHHDGLPIEYYCYARASGMGPKDAYWAMVGALCSGEKSNSMPWSPLPNAKMVAIGKKKFPVAWFTAKTKYHFGRPAAASTKKKWAEVAKANPGWFVST